MRSRLLTLPAWCFLLAASALLPCGVLAAQGDLKLQVQLVWGTNEEKSPNPNHKPVEADIERKLKALPLKWANYFEVKRQSVDVEKGGSKKAVLSPKCTVEVKNLGNNQVEISLFGKDEKVVKRTQTLPKGEIVVLGGNAPDATSWLVIIKRVE